MNLYRTSNPKRRKSLSFLKTSGEQTAILTQLEKQTWIDEIFNRILPIPPQYPTRFGPPGFTKNVFYASLKRETTFFEFGYGLLKSQSILGRGISAVCYEVKFQGLNRPFDISEVKSLKEVLNPKGYSGAHRWLEKLGSIPESIRYPSVREGSGEGINFAIYRAKSVRGTRAEIEDMILTPKKDGTVDVESLALGRLPSIKPIR